jgi:hypothetical protein
MRIRDAAQAWLDGTTQAWSAQVAEAARTGQPLYIPLRIRLLVQAGIVGFYLHSIWHSLGFVWCPLDCPIATGHRDGPPQDTLDKR